MIRIAAAALLAFPLTLAFTWADTAPPGPAAPAAPAAPAQDAWRTIDPLTDDKAWAVMASEGVKLSIARVADVNAGVGAAPPVMPAPRPRTQPGVQSGIDFKPGLRLDYDFQSGAGYAGIKRAFTFDLPPNYELAFDVRGDLPANNFELKLLDTAGTSVWWYNRKAYSFTRALTLLTTPRRKISFAWGPSNAPLTKAGGVEIVVASIKGGRGSVFLSNFRIRELPVAKPYTGTPKAAVSTAIGVSTSTVNPEPDAVPQATFPVANATRYELDFGAARELGGLALAWSAVAMPATYEVQLSDGPVPSPWRAVATISGRRTSTHLIELPDEQCTRLAIVVTGFHASNAAVLEKVEVLDPRFADSPNAVATEAARRARLGVYPKATRGETQSNWTALGSAGDPAEALINEEGQIEMGKALASIEPFVIDQRGGLLTWADATHTQSLAEAYLPIVTITRTHASGLELTTTAFVAGAPGKSTLLARYKLTSKAPLGSTRLVLAARPFQVNPPWQFLNESGGVARVSEAQVDAPAGRPASRVVLTMPTTTDGVTRRTIRTFPAAAFGFASDAARGDLIEQLDGGGFTPSALPTLARCEQSRASAALVFPASSNDPLSIEVIVAFSLGEAGDVAMGSALDAAPTKAFAEQLDQTTAFWRAKLSKVKFTVPPAAQPLIDAARAQLAYIHINRDGPGIQPGSRSYERSWIRDGSMTALALLEFGQTDEAKAFVEWYAKFQFESGRVPCVVDSRGPDPVPEHDSHGQLIFAIASVYRYTGDKEFLARMEPHVNAAVSAIANLIAERSTGAYTVDAPLLSRQQPGKPPVTARAFFGLMPESISHEGYSAVPMHSYWDNFFILRGLRDAQFIATARSDADRARRYKAIADTFSTNLARSIKLAQAAHNIDYIPGCVELGDFDATSTAVAITPCNALGMLEPDAVKATFDRYYSNFLARRDDPDPSWIDYTPYELRVVGAMIMLGHTDRAHAMLDWFMKDRLPSQPGSKSPGAFNHWAEIVHRDRAKPAWIGDMPHTWVGSDYLRSIRTIFVYEDEQAQSLVLFAGVPASWLAKTVTSAVEFDGLVTAIGPLRASIQHRELGVDQRVQEQVIAEISASGKAAVNLSTLPGGIVVIDPIGKATSATVNGAVVKDFNGKSVTVRTLPAKVSFIYR